eukprot:SAG31_NODE_10319_length_1154_cov_1.358294_2_plen_58_part_00
MLLHGVHVYAHLIGSCEIAFHSTTIVMFNISHVSQTNVSIAQALVMPYHINLAASET